MQTNIQLRNIRVRSADVHYEKESNMNNLYHWHAERMVDLEMKEINREIANANLLREAGLAGTGWLTQAVQGVFKLLGTMGRSQQARHAVERQSYPARSQKMAE
jgi:hypothetical protein